MGLEIGRIHRFSAPARTQVQVKLSSEGARHDRGAPAYVGDFLFFSRQIKALSLSLSRTVLESRLDFCRGVGGRYMCAARERDEQLPTLFFFILWLRRMGLAVTTLVVSAV